MTNPPPTPDESRRMLGISESFLLDIQAAIDDNITQKELIVIFCSLLITTLGMCIPVERDKMWNAIKTYVDNNMARMCK